MSALAVATGSINLGQGFPDTDGPPEVTRRRGRRHPRRPQPVPARDRHPRAARARSSPTSSDWYGLEYDADTEVLVTAGATEAIAAALLALCEPGDEVVTFEPYYDSYAACIAMAGAQRPRRARCARPTTSFDPDELARAITPRTRLLLLNSPHNPTGKVFTRARARARRRSCASSTTSSPSPTRSTSTSCSRASTCRSRRSRACATARSPSRRAARRSRAPAGRSAGSARPPDLVAAVRTVKQFLTYVNGGPFQYAIAVGLGLPDDVLPPRSRAELREKRDRLSRRARRRRASPCSRPPAPTSSPSTSARSARPTGSRSAGRCPSAAAWSRCRASCSTTTRTPGDPLVRFACCKRLDVHRRSGDPVEGAGAGEGRRASSTTSCGRTRDANFARLAPMIADAAARRRPARRAHRDVLDRVLDGHRRASPSRSTARARGSSSSRRATHGVWVCGSVPEVQPGDERPSNTLVLAAPDGATHRYRKIHPFTYGGEHEQYAAGDAHRHRRRRGRRAAASSSATTCASPTSSGRSRPTPTATSSSPTGPRRGVTTGAPCCGPGRSRTRPTWWASTVSATAAGSTTRATAPSCSRSARRREADGPTEQTLVRDVDPAVVAETRARYPFLTDRR